MDEVGSWWLVAHVCNPITAEAETEGQRQSDILSQKRNKTKQKLKQDRIHLEKSHSPVVCVCYWGLNPEPYAWWASPLPLSYILSLALPILKGNLKGQKEDQ